MLLLCSMGTPCSKLSKHQANVSFASACGESVVHKSCVVSSDVKSVMDVKSVNVGIDKCLQSLKGVNCSGMVDLKHHKLSYVSDVGGYSQSDSSAKDSKQ